MTEYEDFLLKIMQAAIGSSDGTEPGAHENFVEALLKTGDILLVWNLFERVHKPVLHRLYDMAKYKLEHPEPEPPPPARLEPPAPRRADLTEPDDDEPEPGAALDPEMFKPLPGTVPQPTPTSRTPRHPAPAKPAPPLAPRVGSQRGVASLRGALDAISDISPWRWATNNEGIYLRDLDPEGILRWGEQGPAQRLFAKWIYQRCPRSSPERAYRVSTFVDEGEALDLWRQATERVNIDAEA